MRLARSASGTGRPLLLPLVLGVMLVLVGVTTSALVAVTTEHQSAATLSSIVKRDAALVELFVNGNLRADDLDADGPSTSRVATLSAMLTALGKDDEIARIEIRDPGGRVLVANAPEAIGAEAGVPPAMREALAGGAAPVLLAAGTPPAAAGDLANRRGLIEEFLPIVDGDGQPLAVVALWRDAADIVVAIEETGRDVMFVTLAAAVLLAGLLFLVFRAAQARLSRQHRQLLEATRSDALTGMLYHGTIVSLLADEVEAARSTEREIGVALVDIDNFRLFNNTHGHDAADEVLLRVAGVVRRHGGTGHVARYGPDEFLLVQPGVDIEGLEGVIERVRADLESESVQFGESETLPITVSAGICAFLEHATSVTDLLSTAAVAVAEAKGSGGDQVRVARAGDEDTHVSGSFDVLQGLVLAVDTKDRYTKRHSEDVARYAVFLARQLGLDEEMQITVQLAGLLHDIGKIGIPDPILRKPSKLTDEEFRIFNQHVVLGDSIVRDVPNVAMVRAGIRHHHERWDGGGYVDGLSGEAIPLVARIISVADTFSAMTTTRPYRKALSVDEAVRRLREAAGTQLQAELVTLFIEGLESAEDAPKPGDDAAVIWKPELWVA